MKSTQGWIAGFAMVVFGIAPLNAAIISQPWTTADTDKFTGHGQLPGEDVWNGNTLTLTYVDGSDLACSVCWILLENDVFSDA